MEIVNYKELLAEMPYPFRVIIASVAHKTDKQLAVYPVKGENEVCFEVKEVESPKTKKLSKSTVELFQTAIAKQNQFVFARAIEITEKGVLKYAQSGPDKSNDIAKSAPNDEQPTFEEMLEEHDNDNKATD